MKKILFLLAMVTTISCYSQNLKVKNCEVEGTVTFKLSKGEGNGVDVGSIVYFIPSNKFKDEYITLLDSVKLGVKSQRLYEVIYKKLYNKEQSIKLVGESYIPYSQTLDRDFKLVKVYAEIKNSDYARCLIDNSGKYKITIPEGEYYVLFKSSNKTMDLSTAFASGLIDITKETVKAGKHNIISNVFDIILAN